MRTSRSSHSTPKKFITFQIGNLRFLDSYQFLSTSLEELVSLLLKSGKENFVETVKYLGDHDMVFAKGVYPYAYMTDRSKFDETRLPPNDVRRSGGHPTDMDVAYDDVRSPGSFGGIRNLMRYSDRSEREVHAFRIA